MNSPLKTPNATPAGHSPNEHFTIYTASEFMNMPEMPWLIEDIIPSGGLASVFGPSGVGKSFFCLDMAASVAAGRPWFGHAVKQARVAYLPLEGRGGFPRRLKAWESAFGGPLPDGLTFFCEESEFDLGKRKASEKLAESIIKDGGAGLIIIDTLNKSSPGADENSSIGMGGIIQGAKILQEKTGGAVLLIHHPGKNDSRGMRGHSSLYAAMDSIIELRDESSLVRWKLIKSKDGEDGINHAFRLVPVEVDVSQSGKPIKSCVVQPVDGVPAPIILKQPAGANQKAILKVAIELLERRSRDNAYDGITDSDGMSLDELLDDLKDVLSDAGPKHRKSRTRDALERLIQNNFLEMRDGRVYLPNDHQ